MHGLDSARVVPMRRVVTVVTIGMMMGATAGSPQSLTYAERCYQAGKGDFTGSYLNARYGYLLHYECVWHKLWISGQEQWFELRCGQEVAVSGEVVEVARYALPACADRADSLRTAAVRMASVTCCADGPDGGTYCEPAEEVQVFLSRRGLQVFKFYQTQVTEDYTTETTSRMRLGPYYAVDISQQGRDRLLLLSGGLFRDASEDRDAMVRNMADMVDVVPSPFLK